MKAQEGWMWLLVTLTLLCFWCINCSFALPIVTSADPTQEEIDQVTAEDAKEWMLKYSVAKPGQAVNLTNEISKIQRRAGITVTGQLDDATKKLFIIPRCGVAESEDADQEYGGRRRKKRYNLQGTSWQKKDLTFRFLDSTPDLPVDVQRNVLRKMINKWAEATTLTIREADSSVSDDNVDILIRFVIRYHGDPYPFDGPGGTLAHAYYPHSNRGLSGDAHFDDDERFTTGTSDGINLDWVAVHEFGHSLGLEHSNVRESIMYPWYKGYFPTIKLTSDDIAGIQALYGKPTPTPTPMKTTTEAPTTQPDTTTKISTTVAPTTQPDTTTKISTTEAPTTQRDTTTKISTTETPTTQPDTTTKISTTEAPTTQPDTTTKISTTEAPTTQRDTTTKISTTETPTTQPDTTTKISTTETPTTQQDTTTKISTTETPTTQQHTTTKISTTETPTTLTPRPVLEICEVTKFDSFVMGTDGKTYVFSGDYFWVVGVRLGVESGPTKITSKWKELKTPINSAYTNWDGRMVFFKGSEYWKYSGSRLEEGPRDISKYGLPSALQNPDAAFIWEGNYRTYFFKGENYWRYNENYRSVDAGYPRHISVWGLPNPMNSAMSWSGNRRTYFFKDGSYWKLDDGKLTLVSGYPRSITKIWMKCPTK